MQHFIFEQTRVNLQILNDIRADNEIIEVTAASQVSLMRKRKLLNYPSQSQAKHIRQAIKTRFINYFYASIYLIKYTILCKI